MATQIGPDGVARVLDARDLLCERDRSSVGAYWSVTGGKVPHSELRLNWPPPPVRGNETGQLEADRLPCSYEGALTPADVAITSCFVDEGHHTQAA